MQSDPASSIHLTLRNRGGSVEHYYHYLFGYLVPLVLTHDALCSAGDLRAIAVRSCALMDRHTRALGLDGIGIISKQIHASSEATSAETVLEASGLDAPEFYCRDSFTKAAAILARQLADGVSKFSREIDQMMSDSGPRVVMINRESPDAFYQSEECEIKSAGNDRRSIANFPQLADAVSSRFANTAAVSLVGKPLAYQIALFQQADIVIAQHGAALANLILSRPGTRVLEILPTDLHERLRERRFFSNLANCLDLSYRSISQEHSHSEVKVESLLMALESFGSE